MACLKVCNAVLLPATFLVPATAPSHLPHAACSRQHALTPGQQFIFILFRLCCHCNGCGRESSGTKIRYKYIEAESICATRCTQLAFTFVCRLKEFFAKQFSLYRKSASCDLKANLLLRLTKVASQ